MTTWIEKHKEYSTGCHNNNEVSRFVLSSEAGLGKELSQMHAEVNCPTSESLYFKFQVSISKTKPARAYFREVTQNHVQKFKVPTSNHSGTMITCQ